MEDNRPYKIPWPKGLVEYIRDRCAQQHYIFFSNKLGKAICSHCGTEFDLCELPHLKHEPDDGKLTTYCPECGAEVTPKDMRYGRKRLTDYGRITWTRGYGAVTFIETDKFIIDYKLPHPSVILVPDQQIRISKKEQTRMDWQDDWWSGSGFWHQVKIIKLSKQPSQMWGYSHYHDHLYVPEGGRLNVGTDLQYANMDTERFDGGYFDEHMMIQKMVRYMDDFVKYPATEILEKSGFERIVKCRATGSRTKYLNMRAKDLRKILKVNGADVKKLREEEPSIDFLESLHNIRKLAPWAEPADVEELCNIHGRYLQTAKLDMVKANTDISKLMKRILEETRATGDTFTLGDYADYLEAVMLLGWRLDKRTLYPDNFVEAHDAAIGEAEEKKSTIESAAFMRNQKRITGMTDPFILGELLIRPAKTPQELRNESRALNHCVRTYIDKVARGQTSILFIRRTDRPQVPYFTLELAPDGHVVQCRGDHNCGYPDDVALFIDKWKSWRAKERTTA